MTIDVDTALTLLADATDQKREHLFITAWLRSALGEKQYSQHIGIAPSILRDLYPGVWACGPAYFKMHNFEVLLLNALGTVETTHQAVQLMNRFHATYEPLCTMGVIGDLDGFDFVSNYLGFNTIADWFTTEIFFQLYSHQDIFSKIYMRVVYLMLDGEQLPNTAAVANLLAAHRRFEMYLMNRVQVSSSMPRSRARLRLVTPTATEA